MRSIAVYVLVAVPFVCPLAAHADGPAEALTESMPAVAQQLPAWAKARSGVVGTLRSTALEAEQLELVLAEGRTATANVRKVTRDAKGAVLSWTGEFVDEPGSVLTLARTLGVTAGYANYQGRTFELLPSKDGRHVFFEVDGERLPKGDIFRSNHREAKGLRGAATEVASGADLSAGSSDAAVTDAGTLSTTASGVTTHDLLIYYTSASASKWGQATLESMIRSAVQAANLAYESSLARVTLNVVGLQRSPVEESSSMSATVIALKNSATAQAARDNLGADMVLVVNENSDVCGYAQLWYSWSGSSTNWDAYAGAASGCLSTQTLAHEVAHMQQLDHNIESAAGFAPYPYSYGYRVCTTGGFRDIMSYPCSMSVARINYFSNPNLSWNGYAIGNSQSADGARHLNETASIVAAYRPSKTSTVATLPAAPTSLAASSVKSSQVTLTWRDNATNESGFKVQRSTDGVNYVQAATLGSNATSYTNTDLSPLTTYYYRVSAYNDSGSSGYSNVLTIKTKGLAPVAPANVAAANGGNGKAIVTWTDKSSNETRFDIRRAKWDAATGKWSSRVSVGTVGANATRFEDSSGKGKFRYYVRAANSYGVSAFVASTAVTITGG